MILVYNKKKSLKNLRIYYPEAEIIDITSKGKEPYVRFSPFFPHGNIPIPFTENEYAKTVEGIWQGLKVFNNYDIDTSKFYIEDMKNIKRTERKYGKVKGHRKGIYGNYLLDYKTSRKEIYLRTYAWVLDNLLKNIIEDLKNIALKNDLILLDYNTNLDIEDLEKPLSHAGLVKRYLEKKYPELKELTFAKPEEEKKAKKVKAKKIKKDIKNKSMIKRVTKRKTEKKQEQFKLF